MDRIIEKFALFDRSLPKVKLSKGKDIWWQICKPVELQDRDLEITAAMLKQVADSYDPKIEMAPVNYDHEQGGEARAWIKHVKFENGFLWAQPTNISKELMNDVQAGKRKRQSVELDLKHPVTKGAYLTGLAILGNASPAIKGLKPIHLTEQRVVAATSTEDEGEGKDETNEGSTNIFLAALKAMTAFATGGDKSKGDKKKDRKKKGAKKEDSETAKLRKVFEAETESFKAQADKVGATLLEMKRDRILAENKSRLTPAMLVAARDAELTEEGLELIESLVAALPKVDLGDDLDLSANGGPSPRSINLSRGVLDTLDGKGIDANRRDELDKKFGKPKYTS